MTDRVHRVFAPIELPVVTACGQHDGELGPAGLTHYVTIGGRVTCPDCLAALRADDEQAGRQLSLRLAR